MRNPKLLSGVIGLSGRYTDYVFKPEALEALEDFPIFVSHGTHDEVIPIDFGRKIMEFYKEGPVKLFAREYHMGHDISMDCLKDLDTWFKNLK